MAQVRLRRKVIFLTATVLFVFIKLSGHRLFAKDPSKQYALQSYSGRHLLTVAWEQCDFELGIGNERNYSLPSSTWKTPTQAYYWIPLYVFLIIVIFVAMAVVCDDFFVPSLEAISEKLDLSEDVAGATFMAAGSSAPELFTSIAGVTTESDVGVGTIVGSAVFNLLGIIALSAAFSGGDLHLDWRPLARDSIFYGTSICLFILFAHDGEFHWYEAMTMLLLYFLYILMMKFNPKLMQFLGRFGKKKKVRPSLAPPADMEMPDTMPYTGNETDTDEEVEMKKRKFSHKQRNVEGEGDHESQNSVVDTMHPSQHSMGEDDVEGYVLCPCPWCPAVVLDVPSKNHNGCKGIPRLIMAWILFFMALPFVVLFTWTIPDCSTPKNRKWFVFSFIMSIVWIAALSFGTVTLVGRAGCILKIDKFTMGLVVIAIGTSIPDAMSSILVARDGYGDMAVSNAIGSNVFDIDLGIGLPFLISILIKGTHIELMSEEEMAHFEEGGYLLLPHVKFGIILLFLLAVSILLFAVNRFRLSKRLGLSFIVVYFLFVAYAYIQDIQCNSFSC